MLKHAQRLQVQLKTSLQVLGKHNPSVCHWQLHEVYPEYPHSFRWSTVSKQRPCSFPMSPNMHFVHLLLGFDATFPLLRFLARKNQMWNSEGLIKLCGRHQGLQIKSTQTGWEREQLTVTFWTFWESQVLPHSLMFLFVPLVAVYILLYGKRKMFESWGLFICASDLPQCTNKLCRCFVIRIISHDQSYIVLLSTAAI